MREERFWGIFVGHLGPGFLLIRMRRLLVILLAALIATSVVLPLAVASTTTLPVAHACCLRKNAHQCSGASDAAFRSLRSCCQQLQPSITQRPAQLSTGIVIQPIAAYSYAAEFYASRSADRKTASSEPRSPPASAEAQQ